MALLCLAVFWDIGGPTRAERFSMIGSLAFITTNQLMLTFMGTIGLFQMERAVFLREQSSAMYDVFPYFNAKTLAEMPLLTITPLIFTIIVYFGVGFNWTVEGFFMFFFSLWCLVMSAVSLGYFVSSLFSNFSIAAMIAPILMMPFMLFSGFYVNLNTLLDWIAWFKWINPLKYSLEALCANQWQYDRYENPEAFDILKFSGMSFGLYNSIICLLILSGFFRISAFFALKGLISKF